MKLKLYSNQSAKQKIFSHFYKGMNIVAFNKLGKSFAANNEHLFRPKVKSILEKYIDKGDNVTIISASIENWVKLFFDGYNIDCVLGTQVKQDNKGFLTGYFSSKNCYGIEKVNRLLALFPNRNDYELIAYGDILGDKELIYFADKGFYYKF